MEANIVVAGVPRVPDPEENTRRVDAAFQAFDKRFDGAMTEEGKVEPLGKTSQTVTFRVTAPDLRAAQAMLVYFEEQLVKNGFAPTHHSKITLAGAKSLLRRMVGTGKPWWKFW